MPASTFKLRFNVRKFFVVAAMLFTVSPCFTTEALADELADLKAETKAMEDRYQKEMQELREKIQKLERAQTTQGRLSPETEERIVRMEQRIEKAKDPSIFTVRWDDGIKFQTPDKSFKYKVGGQLMNDWAFLGDDKKLKDAKGEAEDATEFRKARIFLSGTLYDNIEFKTQYDFAAASPKFKDVYMGLNNLPWIGSVRVGQFDEPFGLETVSGGKYSTFMENGITDELSPGRNTGLMIFSTLWKDRLRWSTGIFRATDDQGQRGSQEGGEYNYTGRITGVPWYEKEGRHAMHLGLAYSHRNPHDTVQLRARPESHLAPRYVDTGVFSAESEDLYGTELALIRGPFSVQGERYFVHVDRRGQPDPDFKAYYIYCSYFLTGEHRPYDPKIAEFARVKPKRNFMDEDHGPGAWEIGLRYSAINLTDKNIQGGKMRDITLGLNWYLNPNMRVMWNYVFAELISTGRANIFQTRFQVDW